MFNKTCFSPGPRLNGGAHTGGWAGEYVGEGAGKGVVCKFTAACLLSASWDKCSRMTGARNTIHPKHRFLSRPVSLMPRWNR